ncbi:RES family NAD+ phosphorylase [Spirosoma utsteinense]|uniref:RES domain-containing protein n=1 Tax=Spirosoma utsteinense TaxID=2585773 RepID=A0ABR6WBF4_9BACT|nr:RES family NAD+ phosphorylase [Spirosoma utsteinense]MBC3785290.1 RES domain-containing protein [Spirosoma utsteinense]MBC3793906.1 RES domain-containing protein [Spirosoma utsteinense]
MILYRIADKRYATDLGGTGGLFAPGRWHRRGTPLVYLAEHISLAKLEVLAQSPGLPEDRALVTVRLPDNASMLIIEPETLPEGWQDWPYLDELADITEEWIYERACWIMRVPSAQSPSEHNFLLNPLHPEHATLTLIRIEPHPFDPRLK